MSDSPAVVWFRDDLRLSDNPALGDAASGGAPVLAVYVLDDTGRPSRPLGAASRWWLHHSLAALRDDLAATGVPLVFRNGPAEDEIADLLEEVGAASLSINRRYVEGERRQDEAVLAAARDRGVEAHDHQANLLHEPGEVLTGDGQAYGVFTPYWRAARSHGEPRRPHPRPRRLRGWTGRASGASLDDLALLPRDIDWTGGLGETWTPGEAGAHHRLDAFVHDRLADYPEARDRPGVEGSSRLSPHLKFGEVSPFQVWHRVQEAAGAGRAAKDAFLSELGWREFDYQLLASHPRLDTENVHRQFDAFPWKPAHKEPVRAWQRGRTGIPLVDAGMRQLWNTGWMHNRVRMVTASFLIKNLGIDWRVGEQWFWDCLVDADPANNPAQWQWVAGSGADAAPFFRVFNPVTQAKKFDPDGAYIRQWVPELRGLSGATLHEPWTAAGDLVAAAEEADGSAYPAPIVDLKSSRQDALDAYAAMRS